MQHWKRIHVSAGLLAATIIAAAGAARADDALTNPHVVQDQFGLMRLDPQSVREIERHAWSKVTPYLTSRDGLIYIWFEIAGEDARGAPRSGFAPLPTPNSAPFVARGLLEVTPSRWSTTGLAQRGGGFKGTTSLRHASYRVLAPGRGVVIKSVFAYNVWQWTFTVDGSKLTLAMDQSGLGAKFVADSHVHRIVSELFDVESRRVSVRRPDQHEIDALLQGVGRQRADQPSPWRAPYGAPVAPGTGSPPRRDPYFNPGRQADGEVPPGKKH